MSLTHVCIWEPKIGYRRISIEEACAKHPYAGVPANSGHFVCELCTQNVLLTAPGAYTRHFRHDPASPNKECDERQQHFDPTYGRGLRALSNYIVPIKISVNNSNFSLSLGFFRPPDQKAQCDKIRIAGDSHKVYEYLFERIDQIGTTYLPVGSLPSKVYGIEYTNASSELKKFFPTKVSGINPSGSFFDKRSGRMLPPGSKAYAGNSYYLLQRSPLYSYSIPSDISVKEIYRTTIDSSPILFLYEITVNHFSAYSAKYFLKHSIFLTEKSTKFFPIWPSYIEHPNFFYHNSNEFFFFLYGDDAELKSYPAVSKEHNVDTGKLYKLTVSSREQLVSFGKSGALGFSYLIKELPNKCISLPDILISDLDGTPLTEDTYNKLPKSNTISVSARFDGKVIIQKGEKIEYIHKLVSDQDLMISNLTTGIQISFYQANDFIRSISFEKTNVYQTTSDSDYTLMQKLSNCHGPTIPVCHSIGNIIAKYNNYPQTKRWLLKTIKSGKMSRSAYGILLNHYLSIK